MVVIVKFFWAKHSFNYMNNNNEDEINFEIIVDSLFLIKTTSILISEKYKNSFDEQTKNYLKKIEFAVDKIHNEISKSTLKKKRNRE